MRGRPARAAGPRSAAVCARWGLPVAVIGRVTDDGDIAIVEGGLDADGRPRPGAPRARPDPGPRPDVATRSSTSGSPRRRRAAARRPAPGAAGSRPVDGLPERGMDPGAVLLALSARPNLVVAPLRSSTSTTRTVQTNTVAGPGHGAAVLRVKGTTKALVASTDANQAVGAIDPWLGAALSVAEATRNVAITGARPLGVTNCLNYGDPTRPEAFWQLQRGRPRPRRRLSGARPAGHRRQRLAVQRVAGRRDRADARDRGRRPARRRGHARRAGVRAPTATRSCSSARRRPGLAGSAYARAGRRRAEDGPPALDLDRERRAPGASSARRSPAGSSPPPRTCPAAASRVALAEAAMWSGLGATAPAADRRLAGRRRCSARARRASSSRAAPRHAAGARAAGPPASACRSRRSASSAASGCVIELTGHGATGAAEERGSSVADALDVARRTTCATPGSTACARALDASRRRTEGADMCGVFGAVLPAGSTSPGRRPARSPRSACSPSSTAARNRPGSR